MQTFRDSHASTDFIPICPSKDFKRSFESHDYSEEFQALLDRLEQEEGNEETNVVAEKKCRRLSVNQVKALERNFELENKLEPKRKLKLAEELGLQPRQVAIWFQNRRARYKTKILERDYGMLKASYDALKLNYVNLEQEREVLSFQLRELKERFCNRMEGRTKVVKELNDSTELKTQNHDVDGDDSSEEGKGKLRGKEEQSVIGNCIHRHHPNL